MFEGNMKFEIDLDQLMKISEWDKEHKCTNKEQGAIGGKLMYMFTPTSIGSVVKVRCSCGSEIDVSNYKDW